MSYEFYIIHQNKSLPQDISQYHEWIHRELTSADSSRYDDSKVLCRSLLRCYRDLLKEYPALNGRDGTDDNALIDSAVDYCLTKNVIEVSCSFNQLDKLYQRAMELAQKYGLFLYCIDTFALGNISNPIRVVDRHQVDVYPTIWQALLHSLRDPILVFLIFTGCFYLVSRIQMPYYMISLYGTSIWVIMAVAALISIFLCVLEVKQNRKGYRSFKDVDRDISSK